MKPQKLAAAATKLILMLAVTFWTAPSQAHVEGHMPDSVAEMEYRIFLEFKPDNIATRIKLAMVLMNQDKLEEAEKEFGRALSASPRNVQAHIGLSQLKLKQHKATEALEIIKKAKLVDPDNPSVYLNYGLVLENDNRFPEAQQMYRDGLGKVALDPRSPEGIHDRQLLEKALEKITAELAKTSAN